MHYHVLVKLYFFGESLHMLLANLRGYHFLGHTEVTDDGGVHDFVGACQFEEAAAVVKGSQKLFALSGKMFCIPIYLLLVTTNPPFSFFYFYVSDLRFKLTVKL